MYGKEIRYNRKLAKLTQKEVEKITGIPQATISWIENDEGIANILQCVKLANCFNISLDELIGRDFPTSNGNYYKSAVNVTIGNNSKIEIK